MKNILKRDYFKRTMIKRAMAALLSLTIVATPLLAPLFVSAAPGYIQLQELAPIVANVGWDIYRVNQGISGNPLQLIRGGTTTTFNYGIGAHANAEIVFNIEGLGANRFTTFYGINYAANANTGRVRFDFYVDDVLVLGGAQISPGYLTNRVECGSADFEIPAGAKRLRLVSTGVVSGSNPVDSCHSVWVEPRLYVDDLDKILTELVFPDKIEAGSAVQAELSATSLVGKPVSVVITGASFSSSDANVASVDQSGLVTGVAPGVAIITLSALVNGSPVTLSKEVIVFGYTNIWPVTSPNGKSEIRVMLTGPDGALSYYITQNGERIVELSPLGFNTSLGDFSSGLVLAGVEIAEIDETYGMYFGKASSVHNHANETTLRFTKGDMKFDVIVRAYDDGAAYRYRIAKADGSAVEIQLTREASGFAVPIGSALTYLVNENSKDFGGFNFEGYYQQGTIGSVSGLMTMPLLYQTPTGQYALVHEADLYSQPYPGAILELSTGSNMMLVNQTQHQFTVNDTQTAYPNDRAAAKATLPFASPWRFVVTGPLSNIVENMLQENLSPAPDETKYKFSEWVEPGVTSWLWLVGGASIQTDPVRHKQYIDLAAEMGWKFLLLDEGWQPNGRGSFRANNGSVYSWLPEVKEYADSKGVKLLAWFHTRDVDTPEKIEYVFNRMNDLGIVGVKLDFFDRESRDRIQQQKWIYEAAAAHRLLVNLHGCNKPVGEGRTYPNVLTREGIMGDEYNGSLNRYDQTSILPFTRCAIGPADYTPRIISYGSLLWTTTHKLALNVLLESGIPCMADNADNYRNSPGKSYLTDLPPAWDETRLVDAIVGRYAALARRSGNNWYVAAVNSNNGARDLVINLDFLDAGDVYIAEIFTDGSGRDAMNVEMRTVGKGDAINVRMAAVGGAAVKLSKITAINSITLSKSDILLEAGDSHTLTAITEPESGNLSDLIWTSQNANIATVSGRGVVTGIGTGTTVITAASALDPNVKASCTVTVTSALVPLIGPWYNKYPLLSKVKINSETSLTVNTDGGDFWTISDTTFENKKPMNLHLIDIDNATNMEITSELTFSPTGNYQTAGIMFYLDEYNFVSVVRRFHSGGSPNNCFMMQMNNGKATNGNANSSEYRFATAATTAKYYLRMVKNGNTITGYYRANESASWTQVYQYTNANIGAATKISVGLFAASGNKDISPNPGSIPATFENFRIDGVLYPFAGGVASVDSTDVETYAGAAPVLPATVPVTFWDGTKAAAGVEWDAFDAVKYASPGEFYVLGTVENTGIKALARVTVLEKDETEWALYSPDGKVGITVSLDNGALTYSARKEGRDVLLGAPMGINVTGLADFRSGLDFESASEVTVISESYPMYSGKASVYDNNANERILAFTKDSKTIKIVLRAYDDGVAFRYVLEGSGSYPVASEGTSLKLTPGATFYAALYQDSVQCYENNYNTFQLSTTSTNFAFPILANTGSDWVLYSQAELTGTYAGTKPQYQGAGSGLFNLVFTSGAPTITLPFKSPWRTAVIGTPKQLAESQIFENLCQPNQIADPSWIKPGCTSWSWLSTGTSQQGDGDLQIRFLNLSADMGWPYTLIDHGWLSSQSSVTYLPWFESYMNLAKEKKVDVWVWEDIAYLNSTANRARRFPEWASKGVVGVKVDYFYSESQSMLRSYEDLARDAAASKLVLNFHGPNLPSGMRRTWPNMLAHEAVLGVEHGGGTNALNNCLLPFSRNVLGPMDYTPALSTKIGNYTHTHAAALAVVFECGATTLGDTPAVYAASGARNFLYKMPSAWDESILLDGIPGELAVMARRNGENWYVGAITNAVRASYSLPLDFLGEGDYYASIYRDATRTTTAAEEYTPVTKNSVISIPMLAQGGAAVKIVRELPKQPERISLNKTAITLTEKQIDTVSVLYEPTDAVLMNLVWESSNPSVATVSSGTITAVKTGTAIITVTTPNDLSASVIVTVIPKLDLGNAWTVVNPTDNAFLTAENELTVNLEKGDIWRSNGQGLNIHLTDAPKGDFEVTVKLRSNLMSHVQSVGLIAFVDADHYVSNLRRFHNSYGGKCFAMVNELSSTNAVEVPAFSESSLFTQYGQNFPDADEVLLKLVKSGDLFTGYVSITGDNWIKIAEHINPIGSSDNLKIGLFSTGDATATVAYKDFTINGKLLLFTANVDGSEGYVFNPVWRITRESVADFVSVTPTRLELITNMGDLWNATSNARNIYTASYGNGDFDVRVKLSFAPTSNYQTASLVAYVNDNQYVSVARGFDNRQTGSNIFKVVNQSTSSNATQGGNINASAISSTVYLRLVKTGNNFTGYFSETGADGPWTAVLTVTNATVATSPDLRLGVYTCYGGSGSVTNAVFENFTINGQLIPFLVPNEYIRYKYGGETATEIIPGEKLKIEAALDSKNVSQVMIAGIYNERGVLIKYAMGNGVTTQSGARVMFDVDLDIPENLVSGAYIKVFIWDAATYVPLRENFVFPS